MSSDTGTTESSADKSELESAAAHSTYSGHQAAVDAGTFGQPGGVEGLNSEQQAAMAEGQPVSSSPKGSFAAAINDPLGFLQAKAPDIALGLTPIGAVNALSGLLGGPTASSMMQQQAAAQEMASAAAHNTFAGNQAAIDAGTFGQPGGVEGLNDAQRGQTEFGGNYDPFLKRQTPSMLPSQMIPASQAGPSAILAPQQPISPFAGWPSYSGAYNPRLWGP